MRAAGLAAAFALAASASGALDAPRFEPPAPGSYELPPIARVADRSLLASDGAAEPLLGLAPGEAALVSFVYLHCPDACPLGTATLQEVDRRLAERPEVAGRVRLVTVSFDPAHDTPEGMGRLRDRLAPAADWRFLTAPGRDAIDPVLADFGQEVAWRAAARGDEEVASHLLRIYLVDASGAVRNVYGADLLDTELLRNDAATVLDLGGDAPPRARVSAAP